MEDCIAALKAADNARTITALQAYVAANDKTFQFDDSVQLLSEFISEINRFVCGQSSSAEGRRLALHALRILTRQKSGFEDILTAEGGKRLLGCAGFDGGREAPVIVEALKCLCNLTFQHHQLSEIIVGIDGAIDYLLQLLYNEDTDYHVRFYASRLVFLVSAVNPASRAAVQKANGLRSLCDGVLAALGITRHEGGLRYDSAKIDELSKDNADLAAEMMKTVFNISSEVAKAANTPDEGQAVAELVQATRIVLSSKPVMEREDMATLRSQVTNMIINIPNSSSNFFTPRSHTQFSTDKMVVFQHRDVTAAHHLMHLLDDGLKELDGKRITTATGDTVVPLVTALANCGRACGPARRYWRSRILPTLRTVDSRPDQGDTLKARLVRLMTTSHTTLASTVADFLFVLCKENAGRLIKHTGYGNAAGLLLQRGLLSGGTAPATGDYSSDSSDSDTEEYRDSDVNPMTGGPKDKNQADQFAGMTEEEKEAEAAKLGELLEQLENTGVMKMMRVGDSKNPSNGSEGNGKGNGASSS